MESCRRKNKNINHNRQDLEKDLRWSFYRRLHLAEPLRDRMGRAWRSRDIKHAIVFLATHLASLLAPFQYNAKALVISCILSVITGLFGITLCYHRCLAHASLRLPKWLEYLFAYFGVLALQGDPIRWVSNHRYHHKFVDTEKDPHSPISGFWFSHMGWIFDVDLSHEKRGWGRRNNVGDLKNQSYYMFLRKTYIIHPMVLGFILYTLGGLPFFVWGMGVRVVVSSHATYMVNSVCHMWGKQVWNTGDMSRNNWLVALLTFGEGWHNNHHAFETSARHGLEWWEVDATWYVVRFLQAIGLASDIKLPNESRKQRLAVFNKEGKDNYNYPE